MADGGCGRVARRATSHARSGDVGKEAAAGGRGGGVPEKRAAVAQRRPADGREQRQECA